jgi:hypothetical protein
METSGDQPFERSCDTRIWVEAPDPNKWESPDAVGPLLFHNIMREAPRLPADVLRPDEDGRLEANKYVTVVDGAAAGSVTLSIGPNDRGHARLVYDLAIPLPAPLDSGDVAVRLEACSDGDAQYNGGFMVDGPRCVEVIVVDEDGPPVKKTIPFGVPDCDGGNGEDS